MTTNETNKPPASQWHRRRWLGIVALASLVSLSVGFWISDRRLDRLAQESGRRQVEDVILFADRIGVLDRAKLEEAIIIAHESEWEEEASSDNESNEQSAVGNEAKQ